METKVMRDNVRDYRRAIENVRAEKSDDGEMWIYGTPIIFEQRYLLFRSGDKNIYEVIHRKAFDETDMADVPLKYNHEDNKGTPARTTAKTEKGKLYLNVLDDRVEMKANLLDTTGGTDLFKEIQAGTVPQMSWAFTEDADAEEREKVEDGYVFHVNKVKRVYDVSAVDFGANPNTSIYARRRADADDVMAQELDELEREERKADIKKQIEEILKK